MTRSEFAVRYTACDTAELISFVRQRTGNLRRDCSRSKCLQKLKQLDREVTFRFFDLAPELRNRTYEFLLHHDMEDVKIQRFINAASWNTYTAAKGTMAYPAVLRASRQVYSEACGIPYDRSTFVVHRPGSFFKYRGTTLFDHVYSDTRRRHDYDNIHRVTCPAHLLRIRQLTFMIDLWKDELRGMNEHILPALLQYFGIENPLRKLKLVCGPVDGNRMSGMSIDRCPEEKLRLLARLPAATKLELQGFPTDVENKIRAVSNRQMV